MHNNGVLAIGFALSLLIGWLVGAMANWLSDTLPHPSAREAIRANGGFVLWHYLTLGWYPFRKGICPHCGEKRTWRAPLLELAMIFTYAGLQYRFDGDLPSLLVAWTYAAYLWIVLVIDLEHRRVLNVMLAPAAILALLFSFLPGQPGPVSALLGGLVGLGLFLLVALISRGKMGAGDVKLAGVIGLMLGFEKVLPALCAGMFLGGLAAILLLLTRRATRKSYMAYAPYLSLGALVMLFRTPGSWLF